jgi:hypothetical protein
MITEKFIQLKNTSSDINEHFDTLYQYALKCDTVIEFGVRGIYSTWAFLHARPKSLLSYDIRHPSFFNGNIDEVILAANLHNINYTFIQADTTKINIPNTDLLFIDTWHTYDQLSLELKTHASNVNKYIILHDTTTYEFKDETFHHENNWSGSFIGGGLWKAIDEFLDINLSWSIKERFTNNNGLTILQKNENY